MSHRLLFLQDCSHLHIRACVTALLPTALVHIIQSLPIFPAVHTTCGLLWVIIQEGASKDYQWRKTRRHETNLMTYVRWWCSPHTAAQVSHALWPSHHLHRWITYPYLPASYLPFLKGSHGNLNTLPNCSLNSWLWSMSFEWEESYGMGQQKGVQKGCRAEKQRDLKSFSATTLTSFVTGTQACPRLFKHLSQRSTRRSTAPMIQIHNYSSPSRRLQTLGYQEAQGHANL